MSLDDKVSKFVKAKKWAKRALIGTAVAATAFLSANEAGNCITSRINDRDYQGKTAVFCSGFDIKSEEISECTGIPQAMLPEKVSRKLLTSVFSHFLYTPLTLRQNMNGNHADWFYDQNRQQILDIMAKPEYENVIFIGHGGRSMFSTYDGYVTSDDVKKNNIPNKKTLIQHTCGLPSAKKMLPLYEALGAERGYSFEGTLYPDKSLASAWYHVLANYKEIKK